MVRLANSTERLTAQLSQLMGAPIITLVECRELVERLVDWLDQVDGDTDLEDGGDAEPSLGSHEITPAGAVCYLPSELRCEFDLEEQCEDEGVSV